LTEKGSKNGHEMRAFCRFHHRSTEWFFLFALLIGGIMRFYLAFHAPVDIDENYYAFDGHLLNNGLTPFQDYPTRSPLMLLLSAAVLRMDGDFFALRVITVLASLATGVLVYLAGKTLAGKGIGSAAAVIFLFSPYSIRYGYTFITQPFEALGAGLSFYLLVISLHRSPASSRLLVLSGLILGMTVFVRRTALVLFPAELLILYLYLRMVSQKIESTGKDKYDGNKSDKTKTGKGNLDFKPFLYLTAGFLAVFLPALGLFMYITGLSYTVYFFGTDYIHAHTSIVENLNYTFTAFDTRAFYLLSPGMVFVTALLYRAGVRAIRQAAEEPGFNKRTASALKFTLILILIVGWLLSAFSLLGNNYIDADGGWATGLTLFLFMGSGWLLSAFPPAFVSEHKLPAALTLLLSTAIGLILIPLAGAEFYLLFDAVILLNILAAAVLFYYGFASGVHFLGSRRAIFPYASTGVYLLSVLIFYLLFRVMLPYYYDLLFPLSIITALLLRDILGFKAKKSGKENRKEKKYHGILNASKALFAATLILSLAVSVSAYSREELQENQLKIDDLRECANYLRENGRAGEEILTAKPVIALQAGMEVVFNIVRAGVYSENNTDILEDYHYPPVQEIQDYLEKKGIRFVIVEPGLETCLLDVYPEFRDYINAHYHTVMVFGHVEVRERG